MAKNRYIGDYPAIGIRPIIDGRRGPMQLRENLEDQVLAMALAAKKLFEDNLRYSNGDPVRVVVADSSIGRVPESAACAEKFRREGVAITLSVTPCWCYGSETMDMDPMTIKDVRGLYTWPLFWPPMRKRDFLRLGFMAMRCRIVTRSPVFLMM